MHTSKPTIVCWSIEPYSGMMFSTEASTTGRRLADMRFAQRAIRLGGVDILPTQSRPPILVAVPGKHTQRRSGYRILLVQLRVLLTRNAVRRDRRANGSGAPFCLQQNIWRSITDSHELYSYAIQSHLGEMPTINRLARTTPSSPGTTST